MTILYALCIICVGAGAIHENSENSGSSQEISRMFHKFFDDPGPGQCRCPFFMFCVNVNSRVKILGSSFVLDAQKNEVINDD